MTETAIFELAYRFTQRWEGGGKYHEVEGDPGGPTNYGVSYRFLKDLPLKLSDINEDGRITWKDVSDLTETHAQSIFKLYFWDNLSLSQIQAPPLSVTLFDTAVNCGRTRTVKWLQRLIGNGLSVDGDMGPMTVKAARSLCRLGTVPSRLLRISLLQTRRLHYHELTYASEDMRKFLKGWINRVDDLEEFLKTVPAENGE